MGALLGLGGGRASALTSNGLVLAATFDALVVPLSVSTLLFLAFGCPGSVTHSRARIALAFDMILEHLEELLEGPIPLGFFLFNSSHFLLSQRHLVWDIEVAAELQAPHWFVSQKIRSPQLKRDATLDLFLVKSIVNMLRNTMRVHPSEILHYLFTKRVSIILLPHPLICLILIQFTPSLLLLFRNLKLLAIPLSDVLDEFGSAADECTFEGVDDGARFALEAV